MSGCTSWRPGFSRMFARVLNISHYFLSGGKACSAHPPQTGKRGLLRTQKLPFGGWEAAHSLKPGTKEEAAGWAIINEDQETQTNEKSKKASAEKWRCFLVLFLSKNPFDRAVNVIGLFSQPLFLCGKQYAVFTKINQPQYLLQAVSRTHLI